MDAYPAQYVFRHARDRSPADKLPQLPQFPRNKIKYDWENCRLDVEERRLQVLRKDHGYECYGRKKLY